MSGMLRNLLAILLAVFRYDTARKSDTTARAFFITPFDTGVSVLKSDRYFQFAEVSQVDFMIKTGLIADLLKSGYQFVNLSQLVKFARPIPILSSAVVTCQVVYWDNKSAVFEHLFRVQGDHCARVLVRMKFKKSGRTVAPTAILGTCRYEKPQHLTDWENLLIAM